MATKKMSLTEAVWGTSKNLQLAQNALSGCPEGGWGETLQAIDLIQDCLPIRSERKFSRQEFIEAAYTVDHAGRYQPIPRWRDVIGNQLEINDYVETILRWDGGYVRRLHPENVVEVSWDRGVTTRCQARTVGYIAPRDIAAAKSRRA